MTEPPTHRVATDFDEIKQLREVIDALRANNGRLLRLLVKRLSTDPRPEAKELVETIVHHPQLGTLGSRRLVEARDVERVSASKRKKGPT